MTLTQTTRLRCKQAHFKAFAGKPCWAHPFDSIAESGAMQRVFGKAAGAAMAAGASNGTIVLHATDARSAHASNLLFAQQVQEAKKVAGSVRAAIPTWVKSATIGVDGYQAQASAQAGPGATQAAGAALLHTAQYAKAWLAVLEQALNARLGLAVKRPVLVQGFVRADRVQRLAYGPQRRGSKPWSSKRKVQVSVLTDTDAVIAAQGRLQQLMAQAQPGKTLVAGAAATAALHKQHASTPTALVGTPQTSTEILFADMAEQSKKLGTRHLAAGAGRELLSSTAGRLALAGVLINAIGLMRGLAAENAAAEQLRNTTDAEAREELEQKIRDAQLGWYDSLGGLTGASLDSVRIGAQFMQLRTLGSTATLSITALQFGAALAGTFGGFLNAYVSAKKAMDADEKGLTAVANFHITAAVASFGVGMIGTVQSVAYGAQALALRGIGGQAVRTVAARAGAIAAAEVLGMSVPVIGWGLLAIGVGSTVWAAVLEPSELEAWARQTPFGLGPDKDKFKHLDALFSGLQQALGQAQEATTPATNEVPA